jgi:hypothetical protein
MTVAWGWIFLALCLVQMGAIAWLNSELNLYRRKRKTP